MVTTATSMPRLDAPLNRLALLVAAVAILLLAQLAGLDFAGSSSNASAAGFEPAELRSGDLPLQAGDEPLESRPALTRGGSAMAAVESSRRKLRISQRPPAQPLILTNRSSADGLAPSHARPRRASAAPVRLARPVRPVLARGPPAWNAA